MAWRSVFRKCIREVYALQFRGVTTNWKANIVINPKIKQHFHSHIKGATTPIERRYKFRLQPQAKAEPPQDQTFWGRTIEQWMKTVPVPQPIWE